MLREPGKSTTSKGAFRAKAREETQRLIGAFPIEQRSQDHGTIPEAAVSSDELDGTSGSVLPAACWHAGFHPSTSETESGSTSPQHEQLGTWLRPVVDADTDTREVLDEEEIVQLVSGAQEESEDGNDPDTVEAPVAAPSMDAVNLLRRFAGAHEGAEDALISLASCENCVLPLLTN
ncbi:hypothetical protein HPB49_019319 [Dermacentor silvarum]|uniref:Uncharacterized protein n=1 Tax=Dermacentor silvarum TaxID=543639 RepID=A0ACB8C520_DERSI|nr:hypothetical protein HPB49_019319 [Dermacentor silvarum]